MPSSLKNRVPGLLIVWLASYVFFLLTLVNNFSASHDSINYLYHITKGEHLFHQHHLLYHFTANKWLVFFRGLAGCGSSGPESLFTGLLYCRDHYIIEAFTAFWGSSVLAMVYLFFRDRFLLTRASCFVGTAIVAFSYGTWFYSTNIEVYMPPAFFILCCLYLLTKKEFSKGDVWKIAILHSLAILFHQINVLFAVVVIYTLVRHKYYTSLAGYAAIGVLITGAVYFFTGWFLEGHNTMHDWISWITGYAVGHGYWQPLSARTPLNVLTGFSHAFIGGHFVFQLPMVQNWLQHSFQSHGLEDEVFLASKISATMAWLLVALTAAFAVIFMILLVRFIKRCRKLEDDYDVVMPLIICVVTYSLFFFFWMPEILEFWILQMILVWLLLIGTLKKFTLVLVLPVLLFCINYFGSMRWMRDISNDWYYIETMKGKSPASTDDWIKKDYQRYFFNRSY